MQTSAAASAMINTTNTWPTALFTMQNLLNARKLMLAEFKINYREMRSATRFLLKRSPKTPIEKSPAETKR